VEQFAECLAKLEPLAVILFGSLATGEFTQHSDADVAVIFEKSVDWMIVYRCSSGWVQPLVYDAEQFLQMISDANGIALEICQVGWVLCGDPDCLKRVKETFDQARCNYALEKTPSGWHFHSR
jgi:hypothetical protein